jgi:soluble lytic murein transglycosylase-like protein
MTLRRFLTACSIALLFLTAACGRRQGLVPNVPTGPQLAKYERILAQQAAINHVPPGLIVAIIMVESGGNPQAVSRSGNIGLMQLKPTTAAAYGVTNLYDPIENIKAGARYLHDLLVRFSNNIPLAVAGYNAGAFAVQRAGGIPEHSRGYVDHVMGLYRALPRVAAWLDLEAVDAADACNPSDADPGSC